MDCKAAMARLWEFLDGELNEETMDQVRAHLAACECCLPHAEFSDKFLKALGRCRESGSMPPRVRESVMGCLRREGLLS
jgi:anti-sigma factor (TIGR02949 family)